MSFQAYLDMIPAKVGKDADGLRHWADAKGFSDHGQLKPEVKAGAVVADLKGELGSGHGHAMAIVALPKGNKQAEGTR